MADKLMNSSTNLTVPLSCSYDESYKYVILPLCYSVTFLLSIVLNSTVLLRSYRGAHRWNASLIYMVNLASTDLMYSLSLPFLVASYVMHDHWVFGDFMCRLVRFLFYFNLYCSILFLTCISVHRYMGICHPIKTITMESKRAVKSTCCVVWVVVFLLTCPIFRFAQTGNVFRENTAGSETYTNCFDVATDHEFSEYIPYGILLHIMGFFVPFIVIAWCYSQVVRTIIQTLHTQPNMQEGGNSETGTANHPSISISGSQHAPYISMRRKSIKTIITITFLFALCFLPFHITRTLYLIFKQRNAGCHIMQAISICYKVTRPLASFNSWLNALLYYLTGDNGISCCEFSDSNHYTHHVWPSRPLGGLKTKEVGEQGEKDPNYNLENASKPKGITHRTVNIAKPFAWWLSYELSE
ncbi:P2Y purinoceptor 3 [Trichomycterus rosablanca]|uniref:P2Y purinoceptor 3 n=1 Tax=Trichomycterus rosablanca TaxID=2290929 RepID=UPI002F35F295